MIDVIFNFLFNTAQFKGSLGEGMVRLFSQYHLDTKKYHFFHDVLLSTDKTTTQIDHIFVSEYGIFVIETKNMKGWIFGNPAQATWTQIIYGRKYRFQNPLRQNYKHIKALETLLKLPADMMHSLVLFVGDAELKTPMPENVGHTGDCMDYIKSRNDPIFSHEQVRYIIQTIQENRLKNTRQKRREHVQNLEEEHSAKDEAPTCSRCSKTMVLRTAKRGANAGNQFWGCQNYPRCRYTKSFAPKL